MRYGNLGGEQRESEPAELANFPHDISVFLASARAAGLTVPSGLVGRVVLDGPVAENPAVAGSQASQVVPLVSDSPALSVGRSQGSGPVIRSSQGSVPESGCQASASVSAGVPQVDSGSAASAGVNVGASNSGLSRGSTFSVSFAEDGAPEPSEDDRDPERMSQESFRSVLRLLSQLCPDSRI